MAQFKQPFRGPVSLLVLGLTVSSFNWMIPSASLAEGEPSCVFLKELAPSTLVDPWAQGDGRIQRFGAVDGAEDVTIQNCKGITNQYLALVIGNREASLAAESANIISSANIGTERCSFSAGIKAIPWMGKHSDRENMMQSRLKTLRSCVGLEVSNLNSKKLILGNHASCNWTATGPNTFTARGTTCTLKIDPALAITVRPIVDESCLSPTRFDSGEIRPADLTTSLQAFITSDEKAALSQELVGTSVRRIVFAPSPRIAVADMETKMRFAKTLNLKIQPTAVDVAVHRPKGEAASFVSMQILVKNIGSESSAYPVPLAAEAELIELGDAQSGDVEKSISTWIAYASGQTLIPADWSGLFITDRATIGDFAFKNGHRYRIHLKYFHPHDVPGILSEEFRNKPQTLTFDSNSFTIPKIPTLNFFSKVPAFPTFPLMARGPVDNQPIEQIAAGEKAILQFFRQLGIDPIFPPRYDKVCDGETCVGFENASYLGESIVDFTTEAVPGQVTEMRAVSFDSRTKLVTDKVPSSVHFEGREGIQCK